MSSNYDAKKIVRQVGQFESMLLTNDLILGIPLVYNNRFHKRRIDIRLVCVFWTISSLLAFSAYECVSTLCWLAIRSRIKNIYDNSVRNQNRSVRVSYRVMRFYLIPMVLLIF